VKDAGHRDRALREAFRRVALSGHPGVSWSVILEADLEAVPARNRIEERLLTAFAPRPRLGPVPQIRPIRDDLDVIRAEFADRPFDPDGPGVRIAASEGRGAGALVLAAHHGLLDGLGLLWLAGVLVDALMESSSRGLAGRRPGHGFWRTSAARLSEAMLSPPLRIRPTLAGRASGDALAGEVVPVWSGGTAALIAAAARAVQGWNAGTGSGRLVVAVGASRHPGTELTPELDSAYLRFPIPGGGSEEAIQRLLSETEPQPESPPFPTLPALRSFSRAMSSRLGSTILVSNLGRVRGPGELRSLRFHPVAHGRSGVALGAATVGSVASLTARMRRRDFDDAAARAFLRAVAVELSRGSRGP
jgi:hypothetical protein